MQNLINLEMLKMARKSQRAKGKVSGSGSSDAEEDASKGLRAGALAIRNYKQRGQNMFKNPLPHVRVFVEDAMEDLGVEEGQPWLLTDLSKKINFGPDHRNLFRFHYMESSVLK